MSKRQEILNRVSSFVSENELDGVYHFSDTTKPAGKNIKIYTLGFAKPRVLDAEIQIYGKTFIKLSFQTAYRDLPQKDTLIFKSEQDLMNFLKYAFVDLDAESAYQVPRKY